MMFIYPRILTSNVFFFLLIHINYYYFVCDIDYF